MGHRTIQVTMRYARLAPDHNQSALIGWQVSSRKWWRLNRGEQCFEAQPTVQEKVK